MVYNPRRGQQGGTFHHSGFPRRQLARSAHPQPHPRTATTVRHLEPQVMDLLVFLANTGGRVVSKDEIIDAVWEGRFIAEATLTRVDCRLAPCARRRPAAPQYIETIPKRGYRLDRGGVDRQWPARSNASGRERSRRPPVADARMDRRVVPLHADCRPARLGAAAALRRTWKRRSRSSVRRCWPTSPRSWRCTSTALAESARRRCSRSSRGWREEAGRTVVRIDGRNIEASPLGFLVALSQCARRRALRTVGGDRTVARRRRAARRHLRAAGVAR